MPPDFVAPSPASRAVAPWLEPWLAAWRLGAAVTWGGLVAFAQLADGRTVRTFWSGQMTDALDRAMRSPAFLELASRNLHLMARWAELGSALRPR